MKIFMFVLSLLAATVMYGQADFSGNWKLNTEKSDFGHVDPSTAAAVNMVVEQKEGMLTYQKDGRPKQTLKIDSSAETEIKADNYTAKVSMKPTPDKQGLIEIRNYIWPEGQEGIEHQRTRTWTLSDDNKTLTIQDHTEGTNGQIYDMVLIYERQ